MRHRWGEPRDGEIVPEFADSHHWVHEDYCLRCKTVFTEALDYNLYQRDDCPGELDKPWTLFDYGVKTRIVRV